MNVILSIKPEFVEKIFSGEKQYEYRKILFKQKVDTVYIYASIWKQTKEYSGVTKSFFQQYYAGKDKGVALKIKECKLYKEAVDPTTVIANFIVPQSFIYTNNAF